VNGAVLGGRSGANAEGIGEGTEMLDVFVELVVGGAEEMRLEGNMVVVVLEVLLANLAVVGERRCLL
jgi:hypothetical protein